MRRFRVPDVVIRRLVIYLRILNEMELEAGPHYISSQELGQRAGVSPAQVRKDLASFGEFGKQGVGYEAHNLREELRSILNQDRPIKVAIFGLGELGRALTRYLNRCPHGEECDVFHITAIFDSDPRKIGQTFEGVQVSPPDALPAKMERDGLDIAILTVPASAAQIVTDLCVQAGIQAILNFAPVKLFVPDNVRVHYADVTLELQQLSFYLP
ncbi:MAG: redox-sensing transcriptional repressor Rex [Firmicutes bacterium]|nr:redox-sensing transcriptional repressor Rex [Bacillota bacterium]